MFRVTTLDLDNIPRKEGKIDWDADFFASETYLTVSGQLEGELMATALGDIYTFGPTFRAENSNTSRHASEFWMIEPEMAWAEIDDNMDLAEDFLKYLFRFALEECADDMAFFNQWVDKDVIRTLESVVNSQFERITYTQAIDILNKSGEKFEYPTEWGSDLQSEHERFLTEKKIGRPVIVSDYPGEDQVVLYENERGRQDGRRDGCAGAESGRDHRRVTARGTLRRAHGPDQGEGDDRHGELLLVY